MQVVYDTIGKTYDETRKADPKIVEKILQYLLPKKEGEYLDVGCGSGNYTTAIFEEGFKIQGIDVSSEMLEKAKKKKQEMKWVLADAKKLSFAKQLFDGVICILATHHIQDIRRAFEEIFRVLQKGRFVILTSFPEQMKTYWLNHYFPKAMEKAIKMMHTFDEMKEALKISGFQNICKEKFLITNELEDFFLHAGKYRPHIYLDPVVRAGISAFALGDQEEIEEGLEKLRRDIFSEKIHKIIEEYESDLGDYSFVYSEKITCDNLFDFD